MKEKRNNAVCFICGKNLKSKHGTLCKKHKADRKLLRNTVWDVKIGYNEKVMK